MYCVNCGTQLSDQVKFCSNCGAPTVVITAPNISTPIQQVTGPVSPGYPFCDVPGCRYEGKTRCSGCGRLFCVNHIAFMPMVSSFSPSGWKCRECTEKIVAKSRRKRNIIGYIMLAWLVIILFLMMGRDGVAAAVFVIFEAFPLGFYFIFAMEYSKQKKFYQVNYRP